jgi:transposase
MAETRKVYGKEFKQKAVELSNVRENAREVATELGIRVELLYRWRAEMRSRPDLAFGGNGKKQLTVEQSKFAKLEKELADVKMERDILKKAVGIFSSTDRKSFNS